MVLRTAGSARYSYRVGCVHAHTLFARLERTCPAAVQNGEKYTCVRQKHAHTHTHTHAPIGMIVGHAMSLNDLCQVLKHARA
eukprot:523763-Alexandrium_andersonii.AAC.1